MVVEEAAQTFAVFDFSVVVTDFLFRIDQSVFQTLVISFKVVVGDLLFKHVFERLSSEVNHFIEAVRFQTPLESFERTIQARNF